MYAGREENGDVTEHVSIALDFRFVEKPRLIGLCFIPLVNITVRYDSGW